jgi:3-hydroxyisobutyrate dehydrogenase
MTRIGFIGLGHMGNPMVKSLLRKGYEVAAYDISAAAIEAIADEGAKPAHSVAEAVENAEVVITMLQTGKQVSEVCLQEKGIFSNLKPKSLYIDSSSIDVETSRYIHQCAKASNITMVDAPVSGGVAGASAGTLTFMVGGDDNDFLRAKPILEVMGKRIIHAGPAGNGQVAKICNNMILGVSMIAVSEAFILGKKLGLDPKKFFEISSNASGQCWAMTHYCPLPNILAAAPANNNYQPGFAARMMLKDLRLSQDAAQHADATTPLGAEATALYSLFVNQGNADLDFSGIIKMIAGNEEI